ncbi:MAG: ornithine cyclodeaminase [Chthonomonas sp.]|nr:ornithine cyclodeaminase [Chthonomonas sp.]
MPETTRYIDLPAMRRLIDKVGVVEAIRGIRDNLREDFGRWHDFEKSPRTANHSDVGVIELMPVSDDEHFSFKYVNGHPKNIEEGLMTVMAFGALSETKTGWPLLLSEMTILTALRTAATSVLAAELVARKDCKTMAMIGNGAQSEFQVLGFHHLLGIEEIHIFDTDPKATDKLMRNLGKQINLIPHSSTASAVKGVDIITTCTADKKLAVIVEDAMVETGMHINAIGGDCPGKTELDGKILQRSKVFVEFAPQSRVEGEIQHQAADFPVTELWEVIADERNGRESQEQITVFDSVGFGLEDFSGLRYVYQQAIELGIGEDLDLMPVIGDVKDLFGFMQPVPARNR